MMFIVVPLCVVNLNLFFFYCISFFLMNFPHGKRLKSKHFCVKIGEKKSNFLIYSEKKAFVYGFFFSIESSDGGAVKMCTRLIEYNNTFPIFRLPANFKNLKKKGAEKENIYATYWVSRGTRLFIFSLSYYINMRRPISLLHGLYIYRYRFLYIQSTYSSAPIASLLAVPAPESYVTK